MLGGQRSNCIPVNFSLLENFVIPKYIIQSTMPLLVQTEQNHKKPTVELLLLEPADDVTIGMPTTISGPDGIPVSGVRPV